MDSRPRPILTLCLLLAAATLISYWPVRSLPFIAYDDGFYILDNPQVTAGLSWPGVRWAFTTLHEANWHPLTWLSHQLDVSLFGLWAGGHHLTNLLLHLINTLLLFFLLHRTTGAQWRSAVVAGLFALHPLHVESVAWVAERKDLLCACFTLLSLLAYHRYTLGRRWGLPLVILTFALALLAKPMAVTLPCLMLLLDAWPLQRTATISWWRLVGEKLPLFLLAAGSSVITVIAQRAGGAMISTKHADLPLRLSNAAVSVITYLRRTVWPSDLAVLYPFPLQIPGWQVAGSALLLAGGLLLAARCYRRHPYVLVGLLWFLGMLVPVSGLVQVGQQGMADRYTYLPLIGLFIAAVWLGADLTRNRRRPLLAASALILLTGCIFATRSQLAHWASSETLFRRALAVTERNYVMHMNLGNELKKSGRLDAALAEYLTATAIQPYNPDTHYYLADGLHAAGRLDEAVTQYQIALRLRPNFLEAHNNLGATYYRQGKLAEAIVHYTEALRLQPDDPIARTNLETTKAELAQKQTPDSKLMLQRREGSP